MAAHRGPTASAAVAPWAERPACPRAARFIITTMPPLVRLIGLYRNQLALTTLSLGFLTLINLGHPAVQWLIGRALTDVEHGKAVVRLPDGGFDGSVAWWWAGVLLSVTVLRGVLQYVATAFSMHVGQRYLHTLRSRIFAAVQGLDLSWHQRHGAGEVINRTTRDSDRVRDAVVGGLRSLLELGAIVCGTIMLLYTYHPLLALVPALLFCIAMILVRKDAGTLIRLDRATGSAYDHVAQDISEGVAGVRVIKAFGLEAPRQARFSARVIGFTLSARQALRFTSTHLPLPQLIVAGGHCWVLGCGAYLVYQGSLGLGEMIAAQMIIQGLVFRVEAIGALIRLWADASASAERIMDILDAQPAIVPGGARPAEQGPLWLRFDGVHVRLGQRAVLANCSLMLKPGSITALVGCTGSGKSALAALAARLRDPDQGQVSLSSNGEQWLPVRELDPAWLRQRVQVAFQESFLFSDTLANNLRLADPQASEADLWHALRCAEADAVARDLPGVLAGRVGERGVTLSGGQRQRMCLARALAAKPKILICDDSTSALDAVTEARVLQQLRQHYAQISVLLIASRPGTCALADRVLLLQDGRIAAEGTHHDLRQNNAAYRDLLGLAS